MVPARNRPAGSGLPSLNLAGGPGCSTTATWSSRCHPGSSRAKPSSTARTRPPPWRSPADPTGLPTPNTSSPPVAGSNRCTSPGRMSSHTSRCCSASHTGPSPRTARPSKAMSGRTLAGIAAPLARGVPLEDSEPVVGVAQGAPRYQRVPDAVFLGHLLQRAADRLAGEPGGGDDHAIGIGNYQIPRLDRQAADDGRLPPCGQREPAFDVQRQHPAAPYRVADGGDRLGITAVPVDQGAAGAPDARRGGEQFSPDGGPGGAARPDEDHVIGRDVVKRGDLAGVRLGRD